MAAAANLALEYLEAVPTERNALLIPEIEDTAAVPVHLDLIAVAPVAYLVTGGLTIATAEKLVLEVLKAAAIKGPVPLDLRDVATVAAPVPVDLRAAATGKPVPPDLKAVATVAAPVPVDLRTAATGKPAVPVDLRTAATGKPVPVDLRTAATGKPVPLDLKAVATVAATPLPERLFSHYTRHRSLTPP